MPINIKHFFASSLFEILYIFEMFVFCTLYDVRAQPATNIILISIKTI